MRERVGDLKKAFSSQYQEVFLEDLRAHGEIPAWLSGSFISNGPAQFEAGSTVLTHWFDGFAMLKKFDFHHGKVNFQNRFLHSQQYLRSQKLGHLADNEFSTYASSSYLKRIQLALSSLLKGFQYDNCNVNFFQQAKDVIAVTETSQVVEFSDKDLHTLQNFHFDDHVKGELMLAHPHVDFERGETINVVTEFGRDIKYHIVKIPRNSTTREIMITLTSKSGFYMHSFSITPNYVILIKSPLEINKWKLLFGAPFNHSLSWKDNQSAFFIIVDRRDASVREIEVEAFIALHTANAYEQGKELIVDLVAYNSGNPYNYFYLSNLRSDQPQYPEAYLRRYILDLQNERGRMEAFDSNYPEFPRLNYFKNNGKNYNFLYTTAMSKSPSKYFDRVEKMNMQTGERKAFQKNLYYCGEAIFVPKPASLAEDEGALLFMVFNAELQLSALMILDAQSMQILAEIPLPLSLPFGLHGNFLHF